MHIFVYCNGFECVGMCNCFVYLLMFLCVGIGMCNSFVNDIFRGVISCDSILIINPILGIDIQRWQRKKEGKTGKKRKRKKENDNERK